MAKFNIQLYTVNHKADIFTLLALNTPQYFAESEKEDLTHYLNNFAQHHFILEHNNNIIGCGGFNLSDDQKTGIICWDILHPDFQNKGLGSILLKYRIEQLRQIKTIEKIRVRTSQLVFNFYARHGFKTTNIVPDYWAKGFDLYDMEMPIS